MNIKASTPITIFSLTDKGQSLAVTLLKYHSDAQHFHRPSSFINTAQQVFSAGHRCIFICSTGIVMRALAPVLKDKLEDPPVLVLDEHGQFVIPLLSGHEGGGYAWGYQVANFIDAQLAATTATNYCQPIYSIGLGSDRGCPLSYIEQLFEQVLAHPKIKQSHNDICFSIVASIMQKQNEYAMLSFAKSLNLPFECFPAEKLRTVETQLTTRSEIVFKEVGCYGVAEAAALIGATQVTQSPAELVIPKIKNTRATISVARSYK